MDIKNPIPPCICCCTTLWNINLSKKAINDESQGSVATYLRCGGVLIIKLRMVYFWVCEWKKIKIGEHLAKLRTRTWLCRALSPSFSSVLAKPQVHETITFLPAILPGRSRRGAQNSLTNNLLWLTKTNMRMIKFVKWTKSSLSQQTFCYFWLPNLFRYYLIHCT